jgi:hypothetical protein
MARAQAVSLLLEKFVYLRRAGYDISDDLAVLAAHFFSQITTKQKASLVQLSVSDFSGIKEWTVTDNCAAHKSDLNWPDDQVTSIM